MKNYEELVYAGVLGKVIGVYMGRPFECWPKASLEKKWGMISIPDQGHIAGTMPCLCM